MNAAEVTDPAANIDEIDGVHFSVDEEDWVGSSKLVIALNKPAGFECSHESLHHRSIYQLLPNHFIKRGVRCVGRLDVDTTGLVILTDDGALNHRLTSPRAKVAKTYRVGLKHPVSDAICDTLLRGVILRDDPDPVFATACRLLDEKTLLLTIAEGRYHQVKRMVAAGSNRVTALHRVSIGRITLPENLEQGKWKVLDSTAETFI